MSTPCDCCSEPPGCVAPSIEAKHVAAASEKCGFEEFSDEGHDPPVAPSVPPKFYLVRETKTYSHRDYDLTRTPDGVTHFVLDRTVQTTVTETTDPADCTVGTECAGEASYSYDCTTFVDIPPGSPPDHCTDSQSWDPCTDDEPDGNGCHCEFEGTFDNCGEDATVFTPYDELSNTHSKTGASSVSACVSDPDIAHRTLDGSAHTDDYVETTLSTVETTGVMKDRAVLPAFGDWGGGPAYSSMVLSADETSYAVSKGQVRISHGPCATGYIKFWLVSTFTPTGGAAEAPAAFADYTWTGNYDDPAAVFHSPTYDIDPPASNGTTVVTLQKFSCVEGYTPPDDGSANGWPV